MTPLFRLRLEALSGEPDARLELHGLRDEMAEVLDQIDSLEEMGLDTAILTLEARALTGEEAAQRELERRKRDAIERGNLARQRIADQRAAAERRKARGDDARHAVSDQCELAGAGEAAATAAENKWAPKFVSKAAGKTRGVRVICDRASTCPPVFRRGATPDDVWRWLRDAPKTGTPIERTAAIRCRELLGVRSSWTWKDLEHPERFVLVSVVHVLILSALLTRRSGFSGVTVGVQLGEIARRCAARGRNNGPLDTETISRMVSKIRGTSGECRGWRKCPKCAANGSANCGAMIPGRRRVGLFSDLLEVHQPPGGLPGVPSSMHIGAGEKVEHYGVNLYWLYDSPRKFRAPGDGVRIRDGALALNASNPRATDLQEKRLLKDRAIEERLSAAQRSGAPPGASLPAAVVTRPAGEGRHD